MKYLCDNRARRAWILTLKHSTAPRGSPVPGTRWQGYHTRIPMRGSPVPGWVPALKGHERTALRLFSSAGVAPHRVAIEDCGRRYWSPTLPERHRLVCLVHCSPPERMPYCGKGGRVV